MRLGVSFPGPQDAPHPTPCGTGSAGGAGDLLESTNQTLRTFSATGRARTHPNKDRDRRRPRTVRIHLGRCVRSPTAWSTSCLGLNRSRNKDGRRTRRRPYGRTLDTAKKRPTATFDNRVRPLHDECFSGGSQPADISVINRRFSRALRLPSAISCTHSETRVPGFVRLGLTGHTISAV